MSDLFNPDWKPWYQQNQAGQEQTQAGQQTKNNIPIVQKPINFEIPKIPDIDFKSIASNIPAVQATKNIVNVWKNVANYFSQEEIIKREEEAKAKADLELKKQQELQAKLQTEAVDAQKNTNSFANISGNVASTNNDASKIANSQVGVKNITDAQSAVDKKMESDQKLVDEAYIRDLANQNAIAQTKNESLKLLNDNYNTIQESFKKLGASADKSILDSERQLAETMRRREENRQQTIDNQLQWQNEVARLSGYWLSDNMSTFIAGKMMNFIGKYDSDTFDIFAKWQTLTSNLREERKNLNNAIYSLVTNYAKQKDDLFIQAKAAENMAKYMVDWKSDYINSLKQDIIIKAKEKNIELQQKLYKDIDDRIAIADKALKSEVDRVEKDKKMAEQAILQAISDGSIAHWTPEQKQKYASMAGTTPAAVENNRKTSIAKVVAQLAVLWNKDLSIIDGMTDAVMKLTNSGVDLQDAIKQVAEQNGLSNEFTKLMYNPQAFNLDWITQITQDFTDQTSAQNFANTLKDKYDDIKVVEKNWRWTITGKEKWTGNELNLEQLIAGSGVDANTISGLSSSYAPSSSITQNSEVQENGQWWGSDHNTKNGLWKQIIKNIEWVQIIKYNDLKEPTYLNENTSDELANLDNIVSNYEKRWEFLFKDIINKVSSEVEDRVNKYKEEWISEKRIKEKMRDESYALFVNELNKYIGTSDQIGEENKNIDEQKWILGKSLYHYLVKNNYINWDWLTMKANEYYVFRWNSVRDPMIIWGNNNSELDSEQIRNIFWLK